MSIGDVAVDEVLKQINSLKWQQTGNLDIVPAYHVRDCAAVFAVLMPYIYNLSVQAGIHLTVWKDQR